MTDDATTTSDAMIISDATRAAAQRLKDNGIDQGNMSVDELAAVLAAMRQEGWADGVQASANSLKSAPALMKHGADWLEEHPPEYAG